MIRGLSVLPEVELVAIAESDDNIWYEQGLIYKLPRYVDYVEMLDSEDLRAVVLVNARQQRAQVAAKCLRRGIHVLADKPLCMHLSDVAKLRKATAREDATLFLYLTERYNPPVYTLLNLVEQDVLGQVASFTSFRPHKLMKDSRPSWFWNRDTNGGVLVDLAIHDVDIFRKLTGARIEEIYAIQANVSTKKYPAFEDIGHMMLKTANGVVGLFRADWLTPAGENIHGDCRYFVVGDKGWAEVHTSGGLAEKGAGNVRIVTDVSGPSHVSLMEPKTTIFEDFVAAAKGARPAISTDDILRASELVLLGRRSADRGVPVQGGNDHD
jgi:predicted dehydrogenase